MFQMIETNTNYSEIPTGNIEQGFDDFVTRWDLEVVDRGEALATVRAEWGNGQGYDTFAVRFC